MPGQLQGVYVLLDMPVQLQGVHATLGVRAGLLGDCIGSLSRTVLNLAPAERQKPREEEKDTSTMMLPP